MVAYACDWVVSAVVRRAVVHLAVEPDLVHSVDLALAVVHPDVAVVHLALAVVHCDLVVHRDLVVHHDLVVTRDLAVVHCDLAVVHHDLVVVHRDLLVVLVIRTGAVVKEGGCLLQRREP